ncbi:MAG: hypothetical protein ACI8X5_002622 [Planctomycetota bacterium]|jgi:hypothetical protein
MNLINLILRSAALGSLLLASAAPTVLASTLDGVVAAQEVILMAELAPAEAELGRSVDIYLDRAA